MRALDHLYALQAAIDWWREGDPCGVVDDCEVATRQHRSVLRVFDQPDDPRIVLCLGDCVHAMRQALDHLAYGLAVSVTGKNPPPNENTAMFPIYGERKGFDASLTKAIAPRESLPDELYAVLEGLQPYNGGDRHSLTVVHELDRFDKHRFPPVVAGIGFISEFRVSPRTQVRRVSPPRLGAIEDGTPVVEFIPDADGEMQVQFDFTPDVALAQSSHVVPGAPVTTLLTRARVHITGSVFPALEPFL